MKNLVQKQEAGIIDVKRMSVDKLRSLIDAADNREDLDLLGCELLYREGNDDKRERNNATNV